MEKQVDDKVNDLAKDEMSEIAQKLSEMSTPIFLGVGTSEIERNLINKFDEMVKESNITNPLKLEIALLSPSMLESCYSLYFVSKLSEDELYQKQQADKKTEIRKDLFAIIGKVIEFLKYYYKWEDNEQAIGHLTSGLDYKGWKKTIQIACNKDMSNKEFTELLQTLEEEGMLFVLNNDYTTPVYKRTYCLASDNEEFQLEILTQQVEKEQKKLDLSNSIIQGLKSRIESIKSKVEVVDPKLVKAKKGKKAVAKKERKPTVKKSKAAVSSDGELKQTTEHLNDIQNGDNNKRQGDRELESDR